MNDCNGSITLKLSVLPKFVIFLSCFSCPITHNQILSKQYRNPKKCNYPINKPPPFPADPVIHPI